MSSYTLRNWLGGIISAMASGFVNALTVNFVDPAHFNVEHPRMLVIVTVASMALSIAKFLMRQPLPRYRAPKLMTKPMGSRTQVFGADLDETGRDSRFV